MNRKDPFIYFAVKRREAKSWREGVRSRVASRFGGTPETTELILDDPAYDYRLYRMETA